MDASYNQFGTFHLTLRATLCLSLSQITYIDCATAIHNANDIAIVTGPVEASMPTITIKSNLLVGIYVRLL